MSDLRGADDLLADLRDAERRALAAENRAAALAAERQELRALIALLEAHVAELLDSVTRWHERARRAEALASMAKR